MRAIGRWLVLGTELTVSKPRGQNESEAYKKHSRLKTAPALLSNPAQRPSSSDAKEASWKPAEEAPKMPHGSRLKRGHNTSPRHLQPTGSTSRRSD